MNRIAIAAFAAAALLVAVVGLGAQESAVLSSVSGKVELQNPGEKAWRPARAGMEVPIRATISTGFNGRAVLKIGASALTVEALTRLRIDELATQNKVATTRLSMPVGRIRVEVKSVGDISNDFRIRTPLSTAAVRGTGFETDGELIRVFEHVVAFYSQSGIRMNVGAGESASVVGGGYPSGGAERRETEITVNPYTSPTLSGGPRGGLPGPGFGSITVNWN